MASLPPQLDRYRTNFLDLKARAEALVDGVDDATLRRRPEPDAWSAVECFDHLNTAGWLVLSSMETAVQEASLNGPFGEPPFRYGFISRSFVRFMEPDSAAFPAPGAYAPDAAETLHPQESVQEFLALQDDFADVVAASDGLDLRRIRIASPAVPFVKLSLGAWYEATEAHERRHLVQAERALQAVTA